MNYSKDPAYRYASGGEHPAGSTEQVGLDHGHAGEGTFCEIPDCHRNSVLLPGTPNTVHSVLLNYTRQKSFTSFTQCMPQMWFVLCCHDQCKFYWLSESYCFMWVHTSLCMYSLCFECFQRGREVHGSGCQMNHRLLNVGFCFWIVCFCKERFIWSQNRVKILTTI